jgi:hypothetical protein
MPPYEHIVVYPEERGQRATSGLCDSIKTYLSRSVSRDAHGEKSTYESSIASRMARLPIEDLFLLPLLNHAKSGTSSELDRLKMWSTNGQTTLPPHHRVRPNAS